MTLSTFDERDTWTKSSVMAELDRRGISYDRNKPKFELLPLLGDGPEDLDALPERFTDAVLKKFLARMVGHNSQYAPGIGWLFYDGKVWTPDLPGGMFARINDCVLPELYRRASSIPDEKERISAKINITKLEGHARQLQLIDACACEPGFITMAEQLDQDKMLLNALNGTIDLRNGNLRPHNSADKITKISSIVYDPAATCPTWNRFLLWTMCGDAEKADYLGRLIGYTLTGATTEQVFPFLHGGGKNGKTTFLNVLQSLCGDYAASADTDVILSKANGSDNGYSAALASLRGARCVVLSEVNEGDKLNEARLKSLTGGDAVVARKLYCAPFSFIPQFQIWGFGNHLLQIRGRDHGVWRRIHLVPFAATVTDSETDPHLPEKLAAELSGILAWAVRGCLEWQKSGLNAPKAIQTATAGYKAKEDVFRSWLDECCSMDPDKRTAAGALIASFKEYSGWKGLSDRKFSDLLKEAGFEKVKASCVSWQGISLDAGGTGGLTPFSENFPRKESLGKVSQNTSNPPILPRVILRSDQPLVFTEADLLLGGATC